MKGVLAQAARLADFQRAVRNQFAEGGTVLDVVAIAGFLAAIVLLVYYFDRRQQRGRQPVQPNRPFDLYRDLVRRIPLTVAQREFLTGLAKDLRLPQPTVILLSPALYDQAVAQWQARPAHAAPSRSGAGPSPVPAATRRVLFPGL
ncbi:MAG: hypothetical protein HY763_08475 [Planctomycetes bacterium]|nr:hypothetical protein [Planctomycetota bacterium]